MKKRFVMFLALITLLSLFPMGTALAESTPITPYGAVLFSSDLDHLSGSTYEAWASAQTALTEKLTVSFTLYKKNGSTRTYITSGTNSVTGTYVETYKDISLSAGTYELHASYSGNTQSDSSVKTFIIN